MTIEQLKAAIAALSGTPELAETNAAAIATFEAQLQALVDGDSEEEEENENDNDFIDGDKEVTPEVQALIDAKLKKMKESMNKMDAKLKAQAAATAQAEADAKAAEITRLKEDGKVQEALELELEAAKAKLLVAESANTKLTRDGTLETVMSALDFRNARSRAHAKRDLIDELVQDADGVWKHKNGLSIADAVEAYAKDTENKYLFKAKTNTGGGTDTSNDGKPDTDKKLTSLFELTGEEMLKRAASGKLGQMNF